jgi:hypothetical protein
VAPTGEVFVASGLLTVAARCVPVVVRGLLGVALFSVDFAPDAVGTLLVAVRLAAVAVVLFGVRVFGLVMVEDCGRVEPDLPVVPLPVVERVPDPDEGLLPDDAIDAVPPQMNARH